MPRRQQAYDLNRQVRLLDIHRQFMGGLKTIDTDDALGSAYLRDVDNLSISEFGFLEKRYGTYVNEEFQFSEAVDFTAVIQGYFEYTDDSGGVHKILFVDGTAYIKTPEDSLFKKVDVYRFEEGFDYPSNLEEVFNWQIFQFDNQVLNKTFSANIILNENIFKFELDNQTLLKNVTASITLNDSIDQFEEDNISLNRTRNINIGMFPSIIKFEEDNQTLASSTSVTIALNDIIIKFEEDNQEIDETKNVIVHLNPTIIKFEEDNQVLSEVSPLTISLVENIIKIEEDNQTSTSSTSATIALNSIIDKIEEDNQVLSEVKNAIIHLNPIIIKIEEDNQTLNSSSSITIALNSIIDKVEEENQVLTETKNAIIHLEPDITKFEEDPPLIQLPTPTRTSASTTQTSITVAINNQNSNNVPNVTTQARLGTSGAWSNVATHSDLRTNLAFTFSNLQPSTTYSYQFRNITSTPGYSDSGTATFSSTTQTPPPPTVTATFDSAGGTPTYSSQSGPSPLNVTNPGSPTRSGFNFLGWSPSLPTTITSNTTFTAQWEEIPTVTATFDSAGGQPSYGSQSGPSPLSVTNPGSPTRSGFTFDGWSPSLPTTITQNTTFTAQWTSVPLIPAPSVSFASGSGGFALWNVTSNHNASANYSWEVRSGSGSGAIIDSGNVTIGANATEQVGTVVSTSGTYCLQSCSVDNCSSFVCGSVDAGGCYLTTAMVHHYGYDDDGVELNSMRAVRSYMIENGSEEYITMLQQYAQESNAIVEYIESQENKEDYYQEIKDVVLQVTQYVNEGKLTEATEYYWDYYLKIKQEVGE